MFQTRVHTGCYTTSWARLMFVAVDLVSASMMDSLSVYHGAISKKATKVLLAQVGLDNCYLVRDSETVPNTYCLCVLRKPHVYTYTVYRNSDSLWTVEACPGGLPRYFREVKNLLSAYKNPDQGLQIPLLYPVEHSGHTYDGGKNSVM